MDFRISVTPDDLNTEFKRWNMSSTAKYENEDKKNLVVNISDGERLAVNIIYEGVIKQKTENYFFHLDMNGYLN